MTPPARTPPSPRATPLGPDGAPIRILPDAVVADAGVPGFWARHPVSPIIGARRVHDGRMVREVSFVIPVGEDEDDAIIHIDSLTDRHRTDIERARFRRIADDVRHVGYLLPEDLVAGYRIVRDRTIPRDIGRDRAGWRRVHARGEPDPRCPEHLPAPSGRGSSVLRMPDARSDPSWARVRARARAASASDCAPRRAWRAQPLDTAGALRLLHGDGPVRRLLILFDGERWRACGLAAALAERAEAGLAVVLVDSGSSEQRAAILPHPERVAKRVADEVLPAARRALGDTLAPERVIAAGQSFGGLAAAGLAVLRPDLVGAAIVQSGSFHFAAGTALRPPAEVPGDLVRALGGMRATGRVHVQAGVEEDDLAVQNGWFAAAAKSAGMSVTHEEWAGGHDYAWWTDALFVGLDALRV